MKYLSLFLLPIFLISCKQDDTIIDGGDDGGVDPSDCETTAPLYQELAGNELMETLQDCFTPLVSYSYAEARTFLYTDVDVFDGQVNTIYSKYAVTLNPEGGESVIDEAFDSGINCEHTFPQSQGAGNVPARSDMYHIYPEREEVNSARSFYRYDNIENDQVLKWFLEDEERTTTPEDPENWAAAGNSSFEPSDDRKGDVARSIFYFYLIYQQEAKNSYFNGMKDILLEWNELDPVDQRERTRASRIEDLQGNENPFIIDEGLAERLYGN